jgi:putative transposase
VQEKFCGIFLHHSDQSCQYARNEFRSLLAEPQAEDSMSRKDICYDNPAMESFWASLKTECFS